MSCQSLYLVDFIPCLTGDFDQNPELLIHNCHNATEAGDTGNDASDLLYLPHLLDTTAAITLCSAYDSDDVIMFGRNAWKTIFSMHLLLPCFEFYLGV